VTSVKVPCAYIYVIHIPTHTHLDTRTHARTGEPDGGSTRATWGQSEGEIKRKKGRGFTRSARASAKHLGRKATRDSVSPCGGYGSEALEREATEDALRSLPAGAGPEALVREDALLILPAGAGSSDGGSSSSRHRRERRRRQAAQAQAVKDRGAGPETA